MRLVCVRLVIAALLIWGCNSVTPPSRENETVIDNPALQDSLYGAIQNMLTFYNAHNISTDSAKILLLPLEAACPACRKKTIDSIVKYKHHLSSYQRIVLCGKSTKSIKSYFQEQKYELPTGIANIIIDSTNYAHFHDLVITSPRIYIIKNNKVIKRISSIPKTIRSDLASFFYLQQYSAKQ